MLRGIAGIQGLLEVQGHAGTTGVQGERGQEGHYGTQGFVGEQGDRGEGGERGEREEKGIQGDTSGVLSVLADHLPIQLATRYGEKMCFIKYHISEYQRASGVLQNRLEVCKRYVMLARTTNLHGILMQNLSIDMYEQTCRKRLVMDIF